MTKKQVNIKTGRPGQQQKYRMMDYIIQICRDNDDQLTDVTDEIPFNFQHNNDIEQCELETDLQKDGENNSGHTDIGITETYISYVNNEGKRIRKKMIDLINSDENKDNLFTNKFCY